MAKTENGNAGDPGEGPLLSDEEWADFERSFTKESTKTAAHKEPSARQRALTEKWKKEQPKDTGWRTDGSAAREDFWSRPRGRGDGEFRDLTPAGRRRRRWTRNVAWVLLAVLITMAIMGLPNLFSS
ncbi:MAG: hypothetical protein AUG49_11195 [Catenulispora sp. 13_1_20CM_3_70_7]|nr:hypothetical protein [Catenulisporales bacterium]OLE25329.1 MAG: hypothetical protein AUG49_11195 [Catenulispora sp. 13_1_20CM_3_70_7]